MRRVSLIVVATLALGGCSTAGSLADAETGGWVHYARAQRDMQQAQATYSAATAACGQADVACLQAAQLRYQAATASIHNRPSIRFSSPPAVVGDQAVGGGQKIYNASQCIGAVVNGQCHGSIMQDGGYHPTCHGEMLNGMCTGPMF